MHYNYMISVLGWEERFYSGLEIIIEKHNISKLLLVTFIDYKSMDGMNENKNRVFDLTNTKGIEVEEIELEYSDSITNWKKLDVFFRNKLLGSEVLLNTTTFPRETIWTFLFFLKKSLSHVHYIYFKPETYDKSWLTKNHGNPRLLFKHSGVFGLGKKLVLFVITGFDPNRLDAMVDFFEPQKVILFCQSGEQFDNLNRNQGFNEVSLIKFEQVELDSYDVDRSIQIFNESIKKHLDYNVIISSQGPKTSALSTYKCYLMSKQEIALAYVPAKDFSNKYSNGIDPMPVEGKLEF